jgi:hypothetical protein
VLVLRARPKRGRFDDGRLLRRGRAKLRRLLAAGAEVRQNVGEIVRRGFVAAKPLDLGPGFSSPRSSSSVVHDVAEERKHGSARVRPAHLPSVAIRRGV